MVELPGTDGLPVRLTIKEKTFKLKDPQTGDTVPVLVNRKRTKAAFDLKDRRIGWDRGARRPGESPEGP